MTDDAKKLEETEERIIHGPKVETLHGTPLGDHTAIDPETGMQKDYIVLSEHERAKGFVRPVRNAYIHVGKRPKFPTRELTDEEKERFKSDSDPYVLFEEFPPEMAPRKGRFWTKTDLASGCGGRTQMGDKLAETYARDPKFYSGTFCSHCGTHLPVGENGEFVWDGTEERVGT